MDSFEQRLVHVMLLNGVANAPQLAKSLGYSGSERVRLVMNGTSKPSFGMLADIARVFASVNLHWLITGIGSPQLGASGDSVMEAARQAAREAAREEFESLMQRQRSSPVAGAASANSGGANHKKR